MQSKTKLFTALSMLTMAGGAAAQTAIDVERKAIDVINADPGARQGITRLVGVPANEEWRVKGFKITSLRGVNVQMQWPAPVQVPIAGTELLNCAPTRVSRDFSVEEEFVNSLTLRKSSTFSQSIEASVSGDFLFGSAGVTSTTSYSMSNEREQTETKKVKYADNFHIDFENKGGRISLVTGSRIQGIVPWTATFTPKDDAVIEVTAEGVGRVCYYLGERYTGASQCHNSNADVNYVGPEFNDKIQSVKIEGPVSAVFWEDWYFGGRASGVGASNPSTVIAIFGAKIPAAWSSLKVTGNTKTVKLPYAQLRNLLPAAAREFTINGTVDVTDTKVTKASVVNVEIPAAEVEKRCAEASAMQTTTSGGATTLAARTAPKPGLGGNLIVRKLSQDELRRMGRR